MKIRKMFFFKKYIAKFRPEPGKSALEKVVFLFEVDFFSITKQKNLLPHVLLKPRLNKILD